MHSTGFWSAVLHPDQRLTVTPGADLKLTSAASHHKVNKDRSRTTLAVKYCPIGETAIVSAVIGSLVEAYVARPLVFDVMLYKGESYTFESFGGNILHLNGHFIEQDGDVEETKIMHEAKRPQLVALKRNNDVASVINQASPSSSKQSDPYAKASKSEKIARPSGSAKGKRKAHDSDGNASTEDYSGSESESDSSSDSSPPAKKVKTR